MDQPTPCPVETEKLKPSPADAASQSADLSPSGALALDHNSHKLAHLTESFLQRLRAGERPSISHYANEHPELAAEIRDLFPVLANLEQLADDTDDAGDATAMATTTKMPDQLGEYRLLRLIGQGGMGQVYEAEHSTLRRRVALKVLSAGLSHSPRRLQRFYREARAAGRLHHTNIVPVFEVGSDRGVHYYAMQFIEGCSLDLIVPAVKQLRERVATIAPPDAVMQLALSSIVRISDDKGEIVKSISDAESLKHYYQRVAKLGVQAAQGLQYAHQHAVIHRDIKPANLILDTSGVVWITDFGLATQSDEDLTQTGDLLGTLPYIAPERLRGWTDERADIYSLGLTLYELIALRPAFAQRDRASLLGAIADYQPLPLHELAPTLPADLETVILKAIEKQPERRYRSAGELADDLQAFLNDQPIRARRATLWGKLLRFARRNPVISSLLAAIVGLLAVLMVGSLGFAYSWMQQAHRLDQQSQLAQSSEREALRLLFEQGRGQAIASRLSASGGQRGEGVQAVARALQFLPRAHVQPGERQGALLALRNEALACLALVDLFKNHTILVDPQWTSHVAFDWPGQRYAQASKLGDIRIVDLSTNRELQRFAGPGYLAWNLEFSSDGRFLAATYHPARATPHSIRVWDVDSNRCVVQHDQPSPIGRFCFHPRQPAIAIANDHQSLDVFSLSDGTKQNEISLQGIEALALRYSPSADRLAIADAHRPRVNLVSLADQAHQVLTVPGLARDFAWSEDGKWLFIGCDNGEIQIVNSWAFDESPRSLRGHEGAVIRLALNPTGDRLVSYSWDNSTRMWDLVNHQQLMKTENHAVVGRFSPDGKRLGYNTPRREFGVWEVLDRSCLQTLASDTAQRYQVGFLAGEAQVVWSHTSSGLELFDSQTGLLLHRLAAPASTRFVAIGELDQHSYALLAIGQSGIQRWPIHVAINDQNGVASATLGPAEPLLDNKYEVTFAEPVAMGSRLVVPWERGVRSFDWQMPQPAVTTGDHHNRWSLAISANQRWLATGPWQGGTVCVWDATTGKLVREIEFDGDKASLAFSPDSQTLAISTGFAVDLIRTDNWQRMQHSPRVGDDGWPGRLAFSPDGQLLVAPWSRDRYQLIDVPSFRTVAILLPPAPGSLGQVAFDTSGSSLAVVSGKQIHVWNLSQLRQQLAQLQLNW